MFFAFEEEWNGSQLVHSHRHVAYNMNELYCGEHGDLGEKLTCVINTEAHLFAGKIPKKYRNNKDETILNTTKLIKMQLNQICYIYINKYYCVFIDNE